MYNYSTIYLFKISIRTGDATPQLEHPVLNYYINE